jgi:hypothetical protein
MPDISDNSYEYDDYSSEKLAKNSRRAADPQRGKIEIVGGVLREEAGALLANYKDWQRKAPF